MKSLFRKITQALIIGTLIFGTASLSGCKKKKELAAAQAAEAARMAEMISEATVILQGILDDKTLDNVDENYALLNKVKDMKLEDPGVLNLIIQVQEKLAKDKAALEAQREAERLKAAELRAAEAAKMKIENDKRILNQNFEALVGQKDYTKANNIISNTLPMFAGNDVPVLVIIAEENGVKDYDKPTNIKDYMNYLKDRKAYKAVVETVKYDQNGKISELELRKK
jgi:hypothetical protein